MQKLDDATLLAALAAVHIHGGQVKAAKALGVGQSRISERIKEAKKRGLVHVVEGSIEVFGTTSLPLPAKGKRQVYILTSAQDRTKLHPCWHDLVALADHDHA